jgi:hypothetical protein
MSNVQTVAVDANKFLAFVQAILPVLEASIPAVAAAGGPIGLGVSAAAIALPLLIQLIQQIEAQGVILPADQQTRLDQVTKALTDFTGQEWKPSV